MIITHADLSSIQFCNRGARVFFERHGLDWSSFIQHGIDDSELVGIDDEMLRQVIDNAKQRIERGG